MSNVTILPVVTTLDIPVERILNGAFKANLTNCVVIGFDEKGEFYFAASKGDGGNAL